MGTKRTLPFDCQILDSEPVRVKNPYSGERVMLEPDAVAVLDTLKGAEMVGNGMILRQGLDWFRKHFPAEYMVLLD